MTVYLKDPSSVQDFTIDWTEDGLGADEQILNGSWEIFPDGGEDDLSIEQARDISDGRAQVLVGGGRIGVIYRLTSHISTDQGRVLERSLTIRVEQQ